MKTSNIKKSAFRATLLFLMILSIFTGVQAQTLKVLYRFHGKDGSGPIGHLVRDHEGNLYGVTFEGGLGVNPSYGVIFKLTPAGKRTVLYKFPAGPNGWMPNGGLVMDSAGNLYGTTFDGGDPNCDCGVVFKLSPSGTETVLHTFSGKDGYRPATGLSRDRAGNLYGTTLYGGIRPCSCGTVFEINAAGEFAVLHSFKGSPDGANPGGGLLKDAAGNLYGTTVFGGASDSDCKRSACGTVFKIDAAGKETVLYAFSGTTDGSGPEAGVIMDSAGNLYGTTEAGGAFGCHFEACGTVFKIDPSGTETLLHSFNGFDGQDPRGALVMDSAGNFYGSTYGGGHYTDECGSEGCGTIYEISNTNQFSTIWELKPADGTLPSGRLTLDQAGNLYGTGIADGGGNGTVFEITP